MTNVFFAQFPYGGSTCIEPTEWLMETVFKAKKDDRIGEVITWKLADTPITMSRNRAVKHALAAGADLLVMIDSDMMPDLPIPGAKPFWESSLDFMLMHEGPCMIGAPYCGGGDHENIFVFHWANRRSNHPNPDISLEQFTRHDAAIRMGIEEVGALPTGLIMIDMRVFRYLSPPYFQYEWTDETQSEKASTEDVFFTRNASMAGIPCYVNWDSWAGHIKTRVVQKPTILTSDAVRAEFRQALQSGIKDHERLLFVRRARKEVAKLFAEAEAEDAAANVALTGA